MCQALFQVLYEGCIGFYLIYSFYPNFTGKTLSQRDYEHIYKFSEYISDVTHEGLGDLKRSDPPVLSFPWFGGFNSTQLH